MNMRAKMVLESVVVNSDKSESLTFRAVCKEDGYEEDGLDEDNTFAAFTPSADLNMVITNPVLLNQFMPQEIYYLDFTKV